MFDQPVILACAQSDYFDHPTACVKTHTHMFFRICTNSQHRTHGILPRIGSVFFRYIRMAFAHAI